MIEMMIHIELEQLAKQIRKQLEALSGYTATPGEGVTRLPFTKEAQGAVRYLEAQMQALGMQTYIDASGAVIGRLEGKRKEAIMIGSHYDSVKNGGAYDGIAGVVCGIELVRLLKENHIIPEYSIEVIGTNDEEGARFKSGFFSSKALLGEWAVQDLKVLKDAEGMSIYDAMNRYGLDPECIEDAKRALEDIKSFIEIHIEQGPVLESHQNEIGIVRTIVGMRRYLITLHGRADHAGTTPMNMRLDAMEVASKLIGPIGDMARGYYGAVATVGHIHAVPNEINTIAEKVTFSLDIRCTQLDALLELENKIITHMDAVTEQYKMNYSLENTMTVEPVDMCEALRTQIERSCQNRGYSYEHLNSGAGHDSLPIARKIDTAMIFVPSKGGRSHCKEEYTDSMALAKATVVALDVICE